MPPRSPPLALRAMKPSGAPSISCRGREEIWQQIRGKFGGGRGCVYFCFKVFLFNLKRLMVEEKTLWWWWWWWWWWAINPYLPLWYCFHVLILAKPTNRNFEGCHVIDSGVSLTGEELRVSCSPWRFTFVVDNPPLEFSGFHEKLKGLPKFQLEHSENYLRNLRFLPAREGGKKLSSFAIRAVIVDARKLCKSLSCAL